jgi:hypothetical protein
MITGDILEMGLRVDTVAFILLCADGRGSWVQRLWVNTSMQRYDMNTTMPFK